MTPWHHDIMALDEEITTVVYHTHHIDHLVVLLSIIHQFAPDTNPKKF